MDFSYIGSNIARKWDREGKLDMHKIVEFWDYFRFDQMIHFMDFV